MEQWIELEEFPGYSVSDQGRVRNDRNQKILTVSRTNRGNTAMVSIGADNGQLKRGLALLVCEAFIPRPRSDFNTPIYLDGDTMNCQVRNLAWRPRWFAQKHTVQFRQDLGDVGPIRNLDTGIFYQSVWEVVLEHGVLFNEVIQGIVNKTQVFPLGQRFEFV